jgi:hypothetical protein
VAVALAPGAADAASGERTIAQAATAEARRAAQAPPTPTILPGLKWTAVALAGAGAVLLAQASLSACHPSNGICKDNRRLRRQVGYGSVAAGATLLAIGAATRRATSIDVDGPSVTVTHRLTF